ncbi:MAG: hypothetical protein UU34_C0008G0023 [Candidatus Curtissbacteria bacterium GW2011_GWA1_41_11]|uniref:Uncharacterized protein n=1 Tax=Candidatus Curtissbacteria bacterium GW2011_GWA1_41_11 TaxID=1618409 RepID=A0A0G0UDI2_9BACT|nr:MAG: hypothetical protein UU34_C0008G0023 [Candidatus Curtissbacteria bacterium GW2011_GWA1_41_11]
MSKETLDNFGQTSKNLNNDLTTLRQELIIAIQRQARRGSLNFTYRILSPDTKLLFLIESGYGRFFAEVLTRPEIRVSELEPADNPWELILDYPSVSSKNVCRQIPAFLWSYYPHFPELQINVFKSLRDFHTHNRAANVKI